jgi:hypothetical protein
MAFHVRELREAYPNMPLTEFLKIFEEYRSSQKLLDLLDEAETRAIEKKNDERQAMAALEARLSASEQHIRLAIAVAADVDLEHAQAVLMYGFIMPGTSQQFVGNSMIPQKHVRKNAKTKLGFRFSDEKYKTALNYLMSEGILNSKKVPQNEMLLSLKSSVTEKGIRPHGVQILRSTLEFIRNKS